jgi:hypothetical protein
LVVVFVVVALAAFEWVLMTFLERIKVPSRLDALERRCDNLEARLSELIKDVAIAVASLDQRLAKLEPDNPNELRILSAEIKDLNDE